MPKYIESTIIGAGAITSDVLPLATLVAPGTIAYDADLGILVYSTGFIWEPVSAGGALGNSTDATLVVNASVLSASPLNVLPGTFSYAGLPAAASNANKFAVTTDKNAVFSNGVFWQILYNPTQGSLAVSTGSPLPPATNALFYSSTFVATGGVGALTWSLVAQFGSANTWAVSSSGVLSGTPGTNDTANLMVQVSDSTGAVVQKLVTLTTVAPSTPAATPTFSPAPGTYALAQTVTISDSTGSPTIYYTTNGSAPTTGSPIYTTPLTVSTTQTVKAIATAPGFIQSAVGTAAYTINPVQNPIGINFAAGGSATMEYEAFPTFVDQIRQCRGFRIGTGYVLPNLTAADYPDGTQATITIVVYTGATTLLGRQPWFYNFGTSSYRTFKGTLTSGTGLETISGSGCNIANITRPGGGVVNWDLTFDGSGNPIILTIGTVSTAWTAAHIYLPDYPTGVGVGPGNAFTSDAVNHFAQFGFIRFMFFQNAWNNQIHNTAATRNTPANTKTNKGWQDSGNANSMEGYPVEWAVDLCTAANCGGWFHMPADCANDYITAVANVLFSNMPVGKPIFIEIGNENWNGAGLARQVLQIAANAAGYTKASFTGTIVGTTLTVSGVTGTISAQQQVYGAGVSTLTSITGGSGTTWTVNNSQNVGPVAMTISNLNLMYSYLADQLHNIATIFKGVFGGRYGTDLRILLGTQGGQAAALCQNTILNSIAKGYMPSTGWASVATADYHHTVLAPYIDMISPSAGWTVAQIEANLAGTDGSGNLNASNTSCPTHGCESLSVQARFYGLIGALTYEGGWQTNAESSTITNIGNAIVDNGMIAVEQTLNQNIFNSGFLFHCRFQGGVAALAALSGTSMLFDQLDYSCANLIAGNSPRLKALAPFFNGATPAKNVVNGTGSAFSALNYADNTGAVYPKFNSGAVAPPYTGNGLVQYNVNVLKTGTYSLRVFFTNANTAAHCDVNIDGVIVVTGTSIVPASITNQLVTLGNVTFAATGPHALILGRLGSFNANVTVGAVANSGADITWV